MDHTRINARAIIQHDGSVLVCKFVDNKNYFFPGGGVEFTEDIVDGLRRELQEEIGVKLLTTKFIGGVEHLFQQTNGPYHELNIVFSATIETNTVSSKEERLAFTWMPIDQLQHENVLPKALVAAVVKWMKDDQKFWVGLAEHQKIIN